MTNNEKTYDIILFGMTGFTGKLAVEYMLKKEHPVKWAACARSETKAQAILKDIAASVSKQTPPLVIADLVCQSEEDVAKLRNVIKSTRVVLTAAGPFEKYGITLHKLCAEEGVHYADITGETSFVRKMIDAHDTVARNTNAVLVSHCGNDCIPQDLTVYEMHQYAQNKGCTLTKVTTLDEFPSSATLSGGTLTTAMYQLSKPKHNKTTSTTDFDPLVKTLEGTKSNYQTKVIHKGKEYHADFERTAGPWLMSPVMANCVRRSNALLGYATDFQYGDAMLLDPSYVTWIKNTLLTGMVGAAMYVTPLQSFLPQPGEGPDRDTMEAGYLKLYGYGLMVKDDGKTTVPIYSKFHFQHDIAYYMTAHLLMETGMLLVEKDKAGTLPKGGVLTPAVAFGSELTQRITREMEVTFELSETPIATSS